MEFFKTPPLPGRGFCVSMTYTRRITPVQLMLDSINHISGFVPTREASSPKNEADMNAPMSGIYEMADLNEASYQALIEERDRLKKALEMVSEAIEKYERIASLKQELATLMTSGPLPADRKRRRNPLSPSRLAAVAREIILEAGRPLTRSEIVAAMEARGIELVGADRVKNVGTILWRHRDEFENIPERGYWPKGVPLKSA